MLLTVYEYNLRTVFNEDQYNNFFETETLALYENQLYTSHDLNYLKSINEEIKNCFENVIPSRESIIMDTTTATQDGYLENENYFRFVF